MVVELGFKPRSLHDNSKRFYCCEILPTTPTRDIQQGWTCFRIWNSASDSCRVRIQYGVTLPWASVGRANQLVGSYTPWLQGASSEVGFSWSSPWCWRDFHLPPLKAWHNLPIGTAQVVRDGTSAISQACPPSPSSNFAFLYARYFILRDFGFAPIWLLNVTKPHWLSQKGFLGTYYVSGTVVMTFMNNTTHYTIIYYIV